MPRNPDYNADSQEGVGYYQRTIMNGWRQSTARAFLRPARKRGNLELRTNAQATAITFEGKRATGVRYARGSSRDAMREVRARREVIVCSGAINTPKLLQISGIGPGEVLRSINVPVVHELPGVGENLKDHYSVRLVAKVKDSLTMNELARGLRLGIQIARWMVGLPNILALSPSLVHWFWKSRDGLNAPDIQGVFTPASFREGYIGVLDDYAGMTCGVWQHRPQSLGYVRAQSSDPSKDPVVQPNYLEDPYDRQVLVGGMRVARRLLRTPELAKFFDHETMPGDDIKTDDELLDYARRFGVCAWNDRAARRGRLGHAEHAVREHVRADDDERKKRRT